MILGKILFPNSVISQRVHEIGEAITEDYEVKNPSL